MTALVIEAIQNTVSSVIGVAGAELALAEGALVDDAVVVGGQRHHARHLAEVNRMLEELINTRCN